MQSVRSDDVRVFGGMSFPFYAADSQNACGSPACNITHDFRSRWIRVKKSKWSRRQVTKVTVAIE